MLGPLAAASAKGLVVIGRFKLTQGNQRVSWGGGEQGAVVGSCWLLSEALEKSQSLGV